MLKNKKLKNVPLSFIREAYLKDVHKMAPEYLTETFTAESDYLPEDGYTEKGLIQVKIEVTPHHKETPGIRIYYPYKDSVSSDFYLLYWGHFGFCLSDVSTNDLYK